MVARSSVVLIVLGINAIFAGPPDSNEARDVKRLADLNLTELAEIPIVSAARREQSRFGSPRAVSVITGEEIRRRNFRTVPDAVGSLAGVYLQQTNYGGGSPIVRGMVGNRILVLVDGIRMNNGMYRLGPNQYLNYIDIHQVERIEVVRGAGSVLYGSDAFGAVINVITKAAPNPRQGAETSGYAGVRFSSADSSGSGRVEVSGGSLRLGLRAGFTGEEFGDLRAGAGTGLQEHTGYRQSAGDLAFAVPLGTGGMLSGGFSRLKQLGVDRSDVLRAGTDLQYEWNPQGRDLMYLRYAQDNLNRYIGSLQLTLSFQRSFEQVNRIAASEPLNQRLSFDAVNTLQGGVQLSSAVGSKHVLTYGLDWSADRIRSTRFDRNVATGLLQEKLGAYPDGTELQSAALFIQDEMRISSRLEGVFGFRLGKFGLQSTPQDPILGVLDVDANSTARSGSAHLQYKVSKQFALVAGVAQGFRAPNADDSVVLGGGSARFEIPNALLRPERSLNFETGVRAQSRFGNASLTVFKDRYKDLIDRAPARLGGLSFFDSNRNGIKDGKELDVFQRQNTTRAEVHGIELEAMVSLAEGWTWSHTTTWTRGTAEGVNEPLTRIPPLNGVSRITWQGNSALWVEGAVVGAMDQRRLAPGDISDIRIGPSGTAGYVVFHLRGGLRRSPLAGLSLAWENLTNRRYRLHGSGIDRPGSSIVVAYARSF